VHGAFAAAARPRGQAHRVNPGRPGQLAWPGSGSGRARAPRPGCSLQPHSLAEPGKFQLPGN